MITNIFQTQLARRIPRLMVVLIVTVLLLTGLLTMLTMPDTTQAGITDEPVATTTAVTTPTVLLHYWLFDNSLPNNTPLTTITATYGIVTGTEGYIEYHSALDGYPFEDGHPNWRKASMERRNRPTEINYRPEGNNGDPYNEDTMRGLQIKQPFTGDGGENTVIFHLPTTGYQDVVFQFAAMDEDAADSLRLAYSTNTNEPDWTTADLISNTLPLTSEYQLYTIDFSHIEAANDNPDFNIRIQFDGPDMAADDGDRVTFNNFSLDGTPLPHTNLPPVVEWPIALQQLVAEGDSVVINLENVFADPDDDSLSFAAVSGDTAVVHLTLTNSILTLTGLSQGEATIAVSADDGFNEPVVHHFRALVYPAAYPLSNGPFTFTEWYSGTLERVYPDHMLFLQSDRNDTELDTDLLYAYYIPHDDYHGDDQDTIGFPYNNTRRTRLNGLGEDGISFINTGRGRDLGGALVALDTRGVDAVAIDWLAGTIRQNSRVYALRLQYRLDIDDPFTDLLVGGQPVEYVTGSEGDLHTFSQIPLPAEALEQPYVQLLWRYYHVEVDSGPRAMLRLDDIVVAETLMHYLYLPVLLHE
jgi:hypothetical protein